MDTKDLSVEQLEKLIKESEEELTRRKKAPKPCQLINCELLQDVYPDMPTQSSVVKIPGYAGGAKSFYVMVVPNEAIVQGSHDRAVPVGAATKTVREALMNAHTGLDNALWNRQIGNVIELPNPDDITYRYYDYFSWDGRSISIRPKYSGRINIQPGQVRNFVEDLARFAKSKG